MIIPESIQRLTVDLLKDSPPQVNVTAEIHSDGHLLLSAENNFQRGKAWEDNPKDVASVVGHCQVRTEVSEGEVLADEGGGTAQRRLACQRDPSDPSSNMVQQWISEDGYLGVVSKTYQLTDNSLLGSWAIQVTLNELSTTKEFTVAQYVLPKFEVTLDVPSIYCLSSMKTFSGTVHAKYTYGKPVKGTVNVTLYLQRQYFDAYPIMVNTLNITGSANFTFSYPDIDLEVLNETENYLSFWINASVVESLTGITQSVNRSVTITNAEYNLEFIEKPTVLRPSLNFTTYVISKGNTILAAQSSESSFFLTATYSWAPVASVLVYYVRDDGEVVSDQVQISITDIFQNKVNLSWSNKQVQPSNAVSLQVKVTEPNSLVGILVVDKSAKLLGDANELSEDMRGYFASTVHISFFYLSAAMDYVFAATDKSLPESSTTETKTIRSNFPETWIWNVTYTGASTTVDMDVVAPDTITSWIASAFVMSENLGLGLTSISEELVVFQSFFISLNLPYSVIRGEELVLDVILFNYLNHSIEVMVNVTPSDDFQFVISLNDTTMLPNRQKVYIPSQEGVMAKFPVRPIKLGVIPITVQAAFSNSSDTVIEKILVKAEGIQQSFSQSVILSPAGGQQQNVTKVLNFTLPSDTVQDSASAFVTVVGYQGELRYQRADGSFSAFGDSDSSGSTWLSAFVLKCFLQARPFIFIDPMVLDKTIAWLVKQQNSNGAFNEPGRVIHTELQGGHNGPITLTAYVLIALLEDGVVKVLGNLIFIFSVIISVHKREILSAVSYLEHRYLEGISDNYTLSILTYALSLADSSNAMNALDELNRRADKRGGSMFWSSPPIGQAGWWQPRSSDIELAAYALLSHYTHVKLNEGALVMKWLSQQRNHLGGYSSTQDTVIALQALSQFAAHFSSSNTSLSVSVAIAGTEEPIMFRINSENLLVLQSQKMNIFFNLKSQVASRRRRAADLNEAFELDISVFDSLGDIDHLYLNICTRLIENQYTNKTGMAMMEVGLLSGFLVDQDAIPTDNLIKKVEVDMQKVNIYLDSLNTSMICLNIPQRRVFNTAGSQDATVVVYDYYEPGFINWLANPCRDGLQYSSAGLNHSLLQDNMVFGCYLSAVFMSRQSLKHPKSCWVYHENALGWMARAALCQMLSRQGPPDPRSGGRCRSAGSGSTAAAARAAEEETLQLERRRQQQGCRQARRRRRRGGKMAADQKSLP
ncbi:CD109 protein, partial [Polypterus senegalus]